MSILFSPSRLKWHLCISRIKLRGLNWISGKELARSSHRSNSIWVTISLGGCRDSSTTSTTSIMFKRDLYLSIAVRLECYLSVWLLFQNPDPVIGVRPIDFLQIISLISLALSVCFYWIYFNGIEFTQRFPKHFTRFVSQIRKRKISQNTEIRFWNDFIN